MATTVNDKNEKKGTAFLEHNMNMVDVILRYAALMIIVILGGVLQSIPIMLLGLPFFWSAILGWCPIFWMLGINHHTADQGMK
jgi:hypothetical protein